MNIVLKFDELNRVIKSKSGKNITLSYADSKSVRCTYTMTIPIINKEVSKSVDVHIRSIDDNVITLGFADKIILALLADQITSQINLDKF